MLSAETEISSSKDNKKIYITDSVKRLVDYPKGYMLDFPKDTEFEFGYSPIYNIAETENYKAVVSREYSPYEDIDWYIATYINNFILSDDYCNANNITRTESTNSVIFPAGSARKTFSLIQSILSLQEECRSSLLLSNFRFYANSCIPG